MAKINIKFPIAGINENVPAEEQPANMAVVGRNVRAFDAIAGKLRGGSRPGLSKYSEDNVAQSTGDPTLNIASITTLPVSETQSSDYVWMATSDTGGDGILAVSPTDASEQVDWDSGSSMRAIEKLSSDKIAVSRLSSVSSWQDVGNFSGDVAATMWVLKPLVGSEPEKEVEWFYEAPSSVDAHLVYDHFRDRIIYACNSNGNADGVSGGVAHIVALPAAGPSGGGRYTDPVLWSYTAAEGSFSSNEVLDLAMGPDGTYVVFKESSSGSPAVVKLDGGGTVLWEWIINDGNNGVSTTIIGGDVDDNGNILVVSRENTNWFDKPIADGGQVNSLQTPANIWLLNDQGVVQWTHKLVTNRGTGLFNTDALDEAKFERISGATTSKILVAKDTGVGESDPDELSGDGNFSSSANWTEGSGWSVNGTTAGKAEWTAGSGDGDLDHDNLSSTAGKLYTVVFTITAQSGDATVTPKIGANAGATRQATGTYVALIQDDTGGGDLSFTGEGTTGAITIDVVTVHEENGNLYKLDISDPESITIDWEYQTGIGSSEGEIRSITQQDDGSLWIGTLGDEDRWDPQDSSPTLESDGSMPNANLFHLDVNGDLITDFNSSSNQDGTASVAGGGAAWQVVFEPPPTTPAQAREAAVVVATGSNIVVIDDELSASVPTGGKGAMPGYSISGNETIPEMQPAFSKVYIVDGEVAKVLDLSTTTPTLSNWTPSAGSLPDKPRLIALYHSRIVVSGRLIDPHNWFMSRVDDPDDFNFGASTTDALRAISGNNAPAAGLVGDVVNTMINFRDDLLIFGCEHSIHIMTGDPAARGSIDLLTDKLGSAFGQNAWTFDPFGGLYLLTTLGVVRLATDLTIENLSDTKVKRRLENVDTDANRVYLSWDVEQDGLHVLIVPKNPTTVTDALFWERKTGAWWNETFTSSIRPQCLHTTDAPADGQVIVLQGGADGIIRTVDLEAADDDGNAIDSLVSFGPFVASDSGGLIGLSQADISLASSSGPANVDIYGATESEGLFDTTRRVRRSLTAGRNRAIANRVMHGAIGLTIGNNASTQWALESIRGEFNVGPFTKRGRV